MELLSIADVLRSRRILLAVGLLAAVVLGAAVAGVLPPRSARTTRPTGEALAQVLIDTRMPLVATTTPGGDHTIVQRSVLLAALMASDSMTARIAHRAGIQPDALVVLGPVLPPVSEFSLVPDGQLPQFAATASQTAVHTPYVVQLSPNYNVPIVSIGAAAPDVPDAVSLAQATIATLKSATLPTNASRPAAVPAATPHSAAKPPAGAHSATKPAASRHAAPTPAATPQPALDVESLGAVSSVAAPAAAGVHLLRGAAAAVALLALWCAGVVIAAGLARLWRRLGHPVTQVAG
jgi:hypothetical protein